MGGRPPKRIELDTPGGQRKAITVTGDKKIATDSEPSDRLQLDLRRCSGQKWLLLGAVGFREVPCLSPGECGSFIQEFETTRSPIGDWPRTESQIRPLLTLPKEDRLACWQNILAGNPAGEITAKTVKAATLARIPPKVGGNRSGNAHKSLLRLRAIRKSHPDNEKIAELLSQIEELLDQD